VAIAIAAVVVAAVVAAALLIAETSRRVWVISHLLGLKRTGTSWIASSPSRVEPGTWFSGTSASRTPTPTSTPPRRPAR
jgi:hypothetical protein